MNFFSRFVIEIRFLGGGGDTAIAIYRHCCCFPAEVINIDILMRAQQIKVHNIIKVRIQDLIY